LAVYATNAWNVNAKFILCAHKSFISLQLAYGRHDRMEQSFRNLSEMRTSMKPTQNASLKRFCMHGDAAQKINTLAGWCWSMR